MQLISGVSDLSKIETRASGFTYSETDADIFCEDIICSSQIKAPQRAELVFDPYPSECNVVSDQNCLHQVISNFVDNALRFTSSGGIHVEYGEKGERVKFYMWNTRIGVLVGQLPHIFKRFIKLDTFICGTGLGLSICKGIVGQLGGVVGVDPGEGKSSRF